MDDPTAMGEPATVRVPRRRPVVEAVVRQHAEDVALLWHLRRAAVKGQQSLPRLARLDQRIAANLDGLVAAGPAGTAICQEAVPPDGAQGMFASLALALRTGAAVRAGQLMAIAETLPETRAGLFAAFGWTSAALLQGVVKEMLAGTASFRRLVGIATCALHRADPSVALPQLIEDPDTGVRARALRAAGELGRIDARSLCLRHGSVDDEGGFWASWSAVLLGDRGAALEAVAGAAAGPSPHRGRAFRLALQAMPLTQAHVMLQRLAADRASVRWVVQGSGIAGDPAYVPWLINQMDDLKLARLAGEAVALICGLDSVTEALDLPAPPGFDAGPNDDPDDPNVDTDPDDGLPWPDVAKIRSWWETNGGRYQPGTRYFMGEPVNRGRCLDVLKNGCQRQRILAAHYLCLVEPGTPLFNTSAPAWRQQRLLAKMS